MSTMPGNSPSNPLKSGKLDVCVKGILTKSWVTKQCYLCPAWGDQVDRIEAYDVEDNSEKSRKVWKVFSLRGLKKATAKHKSGENHLDIVTKKEKYCFSSSNEVEIKEWERYLQGLITTQINSHHEVETEDSVSAESLDIHDDTSDPDMQILFDDNILYESADPQMQFEVSIDENADSSRLNLSGSFYLVINDFTLALMDRNVRRPVCIWPYKCIRRYGKTPEMFSIEVGRKSSTGPGNFSFFTTHGNTIFRLAQTKLEKMRQTEMVTPGNFLQHEFTHGNNEFEIPRSVSFDSESKETFNHYKTEAERRSFPGYRHPPVVSVDSNRNISTHNEEEHEQGSHGKQLKKDKTKDKKAEKAEKAKQKVEKKKSKTKGSKKQDETKSAKSTSEAESLSDKGHIPDHVIGKQVLPPLDPNATSRLKHVEAGENRKAQTAPGKGGPPPIAVKLDLKVTTTALKGPAVLAKSKSPTPEELYSLPHGVERLQPFPKSAVAARALRHYEEPDLPNTFHSASANVQTEVENCYDEIEPKDIKTKGSTPKETAQRNGKGITKQKANLKDKKEPKVTLLAYSEVEKRSKAWQDLGVEKEHHVEHYVGVKSDEYEEELYETTEIPKPSHNFPPPITSRDLESDEFVDKTYDHLLVPSTKLKVVIKHDEDEDTGGYSTTSVTHQHSVNQPEVNIIYRGHEYEEAVILPS